MRRDELVAALKAAGCEDAESWADSELEEGIPQFARFLLCKAIWENALEPWRADDQLVRFPEAQELIGAGAAPDVLSRLARKIAFTAVFETVNTFDEGYYSGEAEVSDEAPGWTIMEVAGKTQEPTGRDAGALHESLLDVDPAKREAADFLD